ncbi:tRNA(Met) cytidine acetyltransferase TmcA [Thiosulfatimonas sediminis]|uniref:tRNA(Met) cytidine acetyltransferase TmcA n=1 Tax=Thiosulfatimonas sediminis TaxID=2675054 RepID=A0A6F8PRK9_9GAMM|nr:GNAT family N-acetyltransferase [Thiosulfatimonas sediminis]BBP44761.1 tRNA(Met) cytidine acetyltransferase TmcA [Thiosulfatimonas sediminis]
MHTLADPDAFLKAHLATLARNRHRDLVILQGSTDWAWQIITPHLPTNSLIIGNAPSDSARTSANPQNLKHQLGKEFAGAAIDLNDGLSANTLGIVAGLLQAGSGLFLIMPPTWPEIANPQDSRFLNTPLQPQQLEPWFYRHLASSWQKQSTWLKQHGEQTQLICQTTSVQSENALTEFDSGAATREQNQAITQILKVAFGHRKRPLVLSADRGRGKSAALGLAAVQALLQGKAHIAISASLPEQAHNAFFHAQRWLEQNISEQISTISTHGDCLSFEYQGETKQLKFYAPDYLNLNRVECDLLLIDEAAQIPTPLLTSLLQSYHRMVFATTLHGYEGSGRGFELRFTKTLNQLTPDWKRLHIKQPLRWNNQDPLEAAINQALLLQADNDAPTLPDCPQAALMQLEINELSKTQRLADLDAIFGLLVKAHYQTSPNDLQQLLNSPNRIWVTRYQKQTIGVLLSQEEGGLTGNESKIHGHLVPQLLDRQYAFSDALSMQSWRLMRIAIEPEWQSLGIGSMLVEKWQKQAQTEQIDFISSSFGAENDLTRFWIQQGMQPLHLGCKRDKASGTYNLVVYQALSEQAESLKQIQQQFQQQLPMLLNDELKQLDSRLLTLITSNFANSETEINTAEIIQDYLNGKRPFTTSSYFLKQFLLQNPALLSNLESKQASLLTDKLLKQLSWAELVETHKLIGKKQAEQGFQDALKRLQINA